MATAGYLVSSVRSQVGWKPCLYPVVGSLLSPSPSPSTVSLYELVWSEKGSNRETVADMKLARRRLFLRLVLMSAPGAAATAPQQINVADLELPQLGEVKKQLEEACCRPSVYSQRVVTTDLQELSHLTNSFAQLKQAQAKFRSCIESAKEVRPENKGEWG